MPRRYWLLKSEPSAFSLDDLARAPGRTTGWDGVRNYQARNLLRDEIRRGDGVIFYHSATKDPAAVGTAEVVREGHADPTQFDPTSAHHDPKADPADPRWYQVSIRLTRAFTSPVTLAEMRVTPGLESMELLRRGNRLSVQPVTPEEWKILLRLGRRRGAAT